MLLLAKLTPMTVILSALIASTLAIPSLEVISHFIRPSLFMCGLFLSGLARIISLSHRDHRLSLSACILLSRLSTQLLILSNSAACSQIASLVADCILSLSLGLCYLSLSLALSPRAPSRCLDYLCILFSQLYLDSFCLRVVVFKVILKVRMA